MGRRSLGTSVLASALAPALALALATAVTGVLTRATPAGAAAHTAGAGPYYVAIGASESVGVQPSSRIDRTVRTDEGYTDDLTEMEQARWPGLTLVDFGCPGITVQGALDGPGPCDYRAGSEVSTAVEFVRDHPHEVALVTVDLGFNDVWPCLLHHKVDPACVESAIDRVSDKLPAILKSLRAAGGPGLLIVGLQHADPYVADARFGDTGFAGETVLVIDRLNDVLSSVYRAAHALIARVPDPRRSAAGPKAIQVACRTTWMCADRNIHPTPDGYREIAGEIAAAIGSHDGG